MRTPPDAPSAERTVPGVDPGDLLAENERLRAELEAVRRDVARTAAEMAALASRHRDVLERTGAADAALAAIRASSTWRLLRLRRRLVGRARLWGASLFRHAGLRRVPAGVRRSALGVNVSGYIAAESGMGEATRLSIRTLERAGIPFALNAVADVQRAADPTYVGFVTENPHPFNLVHLNADTTEAFRRERGPDYFRDRYTIGFWFWELASFREDWLNVFGLVDEVWVASRFVRNAVAGKAPASVPVVKMPLPVVTPEVPAGVGRAHFGIPDGCYAFLFTFDVSSLAERKNPLAVVRAFRQMGLPHDRAVLVLKFKNGSWDPAAVRRLSEAAQGAHVLMFDATMDRPELNALMGACDAYVSLHRAEGFGLTMAEAMALGKPVIATAYSGNMDFMTADTAWLVDYRLTPITASHGPYLAGFEWAEPSIDDAAQAMRHMVECPDWAAELGRRGRVSIGHQLGLDAAARRYRGRLEAIRAGRPAADADQ